MAVDSLQDRLELDFQGLIQNLALSSATGGTGNIGSNVVIQNLLDQLHVKYPCVLITAQGMTEEEDGGSFEEDYVVYPVLVLICDIARPNFQKARADYLQWRHNIAQAFRGLVNYPLTLNCPELQVTYVRPMPILPDGVAAKEFVQSGLVILCHTTELRVRS